MASTEDFNDLAFKATALAQIAALARVTGDPAVRVAVLDSGVDIQHPLLRGIIVGGLDTVDLTTQNPPSGFPWAGDFMRADPDPSDDLGHGTHVAGITRHSRAACRPGASRAADRRARVR